MRSVDLLTYQRTEVVPSRDMMTIKLRYKDPDADTSQLITKAIGIDDLGDAVTGDLRFAAAVAEFGMLLRNSAHKGSASYDQVVQMAQQSLGEDRFGYRAEFIELVKRAKNVDHRTLSPGDEDEGISFKQ